MAASPSTPERTRPFRNVCFGASPTAHGGLDPASTLALFTDERRRLAR